MSAVQLLEQLGANANLQDDKQLANTVLDQINEHTETLWCILFPAEDDESEDDGQEEQEGNSTISLH